MDIKIPGKGLLQIENLLLDYNGTIACDGKIIPGVKNKIKVIEKLGIAVHVLTADTHGTVRRECDGMSVNIQVFDTASAGYSKKEIAKKLGHESCACIGNGFNDGMMFETCALSIVVVGQEGCSVKALTKADLACKTIDDAFDLILNPTRVVAGLRG